MADERRLHTREQRQAEAEDVAHQAASFYLTLRARKVPAPAAQSMSEAYVAGIVGQDLPPESWTP